MCKFFLRVVIFLVTLPLLITLIPVYLILVVLYVLLMRLPLSCLCRRDVQYTNDHGELVRSIPHAESPFDMVKEPILALLFTAPCHYYVSFVFDHKVANNLVRIRRRFENGRHDDVISNQSNVKIYGGNTLDQFRQFIQQNAINDSEYGSIGRESAAIKSNHVHKVEVTFSSMDSLSAAIAEYQSDSASICILDLASRKHVGGWGWSPFGGSQEEDLIRCSNLYWLLHPDWNGHLRSQLKENEITDSHIPYFGTTYIPNVVFMNENVEYRFDVIASAAPDMRTHSNEYKSFFGSASYEERRAVIIRKLEAVMATCIATNVNVLIAGAFGCGAFQCDTKMVAQCFKEVLNSQRFIGKNLRKVVFAIAYDDVKLKVFRECIKSEYLVTCT